MAIVMNQLIPANAGVPGYAVAKVLARETATQFAAYRGANVGVGPASCCAAVAINPHANYPVIAGQAYSAMYGNSRMLAGGLALGAAGGHAERAVLGAVNHHGMALHDFNPAGGANHYVMYVDLTPCAGCTGWLAAGSPATALFTGANAGNTLHVFWRWVLPVVNPTAPIHGPWGMAAFHARPTAAQTAEIAGATW